MKRIALILLMATCGVLFCCFLARATDISSFPWTMASQPDLRNQCEDGVGACGASVTWNATGGWNSQPAVIIHPPTSLSSAGNGEYAGIYILNFTGAVDNPTIIHVRFMLNIGADYFAAEHAGNDMGDKFMIVQLNNDSGPRPMMKLEPDCSASLFSALGLHTSDATDIFSAGQDPGNYWCPESNAPVNTADFGGTWLCIEYALDTTTGQEHLYGWTSDGTTLTGYLFSTYFNDSSTINLIEGIGWYWNGFVSTSVGTADSRSIKISHLVIDDEYIGPPAGFVTGSDTTPPTLQSATIGASGTIINLFFDESVSIGAGGNGGVVLSMSGGAVTASYSSGSGTSLLAYSLSRTVYSNESGTVSYTQPGNGIEDAAGNDLSTFSGSSVTNNGPSPTAGGSATKMDGPGHMTMGGTGSAGMQ